MEISEIQKMAEIEKGNWWFRAKRDLILGQLTNSKPGLLLDMGCGGGANMAAFRKFHRVVGCDISQEALKFCKENGNDLLVLCKAEELPFKENVFDYVTALDVLEHVKNDEKAIGDISYVLRKGGLSLTTVPAHMFMWTKHDELLHHQRRYRYSEFLTKMKHSGMKISKVSYWNFFIFPGVLIYKIFNSTVSGETDTKKENIILNWLLNSVVRIENKIIKKMQLPFGVSIFCVAEKSKK